RLEQCCGDFRARTADGEAAEGAQARGESGIEQEAALAALGFVEQERLPARLDVINDAGDVVLTIAMRLERLAVVGLGGLGQHAQVVAARALSKRLNGFIDAAAQRVDCGQVQNAAKQNNTVEFV